MGDDAVDWDAFLDLDRFPEWPAPSNVTLAGANVEGGQSASAPKLDSLPYFTTGLGHSTTLDGYANPQSGHLALPGLTCRPDIENAAMHYGEPALQHANPLTLCDPVGKATTAMAGATFVGDHGTPFASEPVKSCICIACLSLGSDNMANESTEICYRVPVCGQTFTHAENILHLYRFCSDHEISHFGFGTKYKCSEHNCNAVIKKFSDLRRHYTFKHCANRPEYPCPVIGCKYSGNNGFPRKDKLKSHFNNMHKGNFPATGGPPALATPVARTYGPRNGDTEGHH